MKIIKLKEEQMVKKNKKITKPIIEKPEYKEQVGIRDLSKGMKWDGGKLRWELLDLKLLEPIVYRYTAGAEKYGPNNWQKVENGAERYYAAAMRHLVDYRSGERDDPDPRFAEFPSHLAAAIWNLISCLHFEMEERKKEQKG